MSTPQTVVLVEGESDRVALHALAGRLDRDLAAEGVEVVPMHGITNIRAHAERFGPHGERRWLSGLYDIGEEHHVRRGLTAAGLPVDGVGGPAEIVA